VGGDEAAIVKSVREGSPAFEAGVEPGDRVLEVDGAPVRDALDCCFALLGRGADDRVSLKLARGGTSVSTSLKLREKPRPDGAQLARARLGVQVQMLAADELRGLGLRARSAVAAGAIDAGGPADGVDMEPGDILVELNGRYPATIDDVGLLLEQVKPGDPVRISFMRISGFTRAQWTVTVTAR
jgi:serine protease Do